MNKQKFEDKITELKATEKQDVNHGEIIVIRAYMTTNESMESDILVLDRGMFPKEMPEVIQALHDYGVNEFIFANSSTALMQNLHDFMEAGFKVEGPAEYKQILPWNEDGIVKKGLLMKLA